MTALELYEKVEADENLVGGLRHGGTLKAEAVITHKGNKLITTIPLSVLGSVSWDEHVRPVLYGTREPNALFSMTRVVGYYSRTDNWNASKLGELRDRQAGTYTLPESPAPVAIPHPVSEEVAA